MKKWEPPRFLDDNGVQVFDPGGDPSINIMPIFPPIAILSYSWGKIHGFRRFAQIKNDNEEAESRKAPGGMREKTYFTGQA